MCSFLEPYTDKDIGKLNFCFLQLYRWAFTSSLNLPLLLACSIDIIMSAIDLLSSGLVQVLEVLENA